MQVRRRRLSAATECDLPAVALSKKHFLQDHRWIAAVTRNAITCQCAASRLCKATRRPVTETCRAVRSLFLPNWDDGPSFEGSSLIIRQSSGPYRRPTSTSTACSMPPTKAHASPPRENAIHLSSENGFSSDTIVENGTRCHGSSRCASSTLCHRCRSMELTL